MKNRICGGDTAPITDGLSFTREGGYVRSQVI